MPDTKRTSNARASLADRAFTFADILAPMTPETFFAEYYDRKPLHIPGGPEKFPGLMDFAILSRLLNMSGIWSANSLQLVLDRERVPPARYCVAAKNRDGQDVMQPVGEKVMALLKAGASLVANDIDSLTPELAAVADAMEDALTAKTQGNLYCSWRQRQAFTSHYDTHDVYALHLEGEKVWRVYRNRAPHPIRHAAFLLPDEVLERDRGDVLTEVTMRPGDVLYLPRGQYHDALATAETAIHVAFSATGVIGLDFIGAMTDMAVGDELFRLNFPRRDEGKQALAAHIASLCERFSEIANSPEFIERFHRFQQDFRYARGGVALPVRVSAQPYELTDPSTRVAPFRDGQALVRGNNAVPIPKDKAAVVRWMVEAGRFTDAELAAAFPDAPRTGLNETLIDLVRMGALVRK